MMLWLLLVVGVSVGGSVLPRPPEVQKCEHIVADMCRDLPYNYTSFPNMIGFETAAESSDGLSTFEPLINVGCSAQLKFFLCSVYFPMCTDKLPHPIGPCRPLCESVKMKCLPLLKDFGFAWPPTLECARFPLENNNDAMCMKGPGEDESVAVQSKSDKSSKSSNSASAEEDHRGPPHFRHTSCPKDHIYLNRTSACVPVCKAAHGVKDKDRDTASTALFILSLLSVVISSICLITCTTRSSSSLDRPSLRPLPETALLCCAASFACSSLVYLLSLLYREQISCTTYGNHQLFIVSSVVSHVPCTSVAAVIYYFGTAGRVWWFVVIAAWHSSATNNVMERYRVHVEMLAWAAPLALVMFSLVARSVSADPLSGICYVGAASKTSDTIFNLLREVVLVVGSAVPLLIGCLMRAGRATAPSGLLHHPSQGTPSPSSSIYGIIGMLYPVCGLFYMLSFFHDAVQAPTPAWERSWNLISGIKILYDPLLGVIAAGSCIFTLLTGVFANYRSPLGAKGGYVPAVPRIPQPAVPTSAPPSGAPTRYYRLQ